MKNVNYIQHKRSSAVSSGSPVYPSPLVLEYGELAMNYAASAETLFIKNSDGVVVPFSSDERYTEKMLGSGFTEHTVTEVIEENELAVARALVDLDDRVIEVSGALDDKQDTLVSGVNIKTISGISILGSGDIEIDAPTIEVDDELSSSSTNPVENRVITNALSGKADVTATTGYIDGVEYVVNGSAHTIVFYHGLTEVDSINANDFIKDGMVDSVQVSGSDLVITFNTDAGKEDIVIPLTDIFDPSNYYDKGQVDALLSGKSDVSDLEYVSGQVDDLSDVVEGKQDKFDNEDVLSGISSSDIENWEDKYTKSEVDDIVSSATDDMATMTWVGEQGFLTDEDISGKVDTSAFTEVIGSGFTESSITEVIESDEKITAAALNELNDIKQNLLVSGVNIKTISGISILGSGDIEIDVPTIEVDDELSSSSTNPVENRVIASAINEIHDVIGTGFSESSVTDVFYENEFVVSNALTDLDYRIITVSGDLDTHVADLSVHVTSQEKTAWNAKPSMNDVQTWVGEQGYATSEDITSAVSGKVDTSAFTAYQETVSTTYATKSELSDVESDVETVSGMVTAHTANTTIHVTSEDKANWNAKVDVTSMTQAINAAVSGKADQSDLDIVSGAVDVIDGKIAIVSGAIPSVDDYFDGVQYDSNTKRINFYHGGASTGTVLAYVDATDFIKDGMVDNVEISGSDLVITFNTDAGKEPIAIPLTDIFDPSNYYQKSETSGATELSTAFAAKADASDLTAHVSDTDIHVTSGDKATWNAKADKTYVDNIFGSAFTQVGADNITKVIEDDELAISTALNVLSGMITDLSLEVDDKADIFDLDVLSGKAITTVAGSGATVTVTTNPDGTRHLDLVVEGGGEGLSSLTFNEVSAVIADKSASLTVDSNDITLGSGYTGEDVTANTGSGVVHLTPVSSDTISDAIGKLTTVIVDDEVAISTALNTLSGMITDLSLEVDDKADGFDLEVLSGKAITTVAGSGATVTVTTNPDGTRHLDLVVEGGDEGLSSLTFNNVSAVIENKSASLAVDAGDITLGSGYTGEDVTANTGSGVVHLAPVSGDTISDAIDKLTTAIVDNEEVFAAALNVVSGAIDTHASDTSLHVSSAEKSALNGYDSTKGTLEARISYLENIITNLTTINVTGY